MSEQYTPGVCADAAGELASPVDQDAVREERANILHDTVWPSLDERAFSDPDTAQD